MRRLLCFPLILTAIALHAAQPESGFVLQPETKVSLGVVAYTKPSPNEPVVNATIEAFQRRFGRNNVIVREFTMAELSHAVRYGGVDVFIASAGFYWKLIQEGAVAVASLASHAYPNPNRGEGSVFVVPQNSQILTFADMKGKRAGATTQTGFTGWLIPMGEIVNRGYDYEKFFASVDFAGPGRRAEEMLGRLRNGEIDVAMLRQCWLEAHIKAHPEDAGYFRVIEPRKLSQKEVSEGACLRSTDLYPSWVTATAPTTPPEISKVAVEALFTMPATPDGHYWSVGTDFRPVDELYKKLRLGPYAWTRNWTFARVWAEYGNVLLVLLAVALGWLWHSVRVTRLVSVRTAELQKALVREHKLKAEASDASERIGKMQRTGIVGQISSMIAHELRQPMAAALLYAKSARKLIERGSPDPAVMLDVLSRIESETERANRIIDNVRAYAKGKSREREPTDLRDVMIKAAESLRRTGRFTGVDISVEADAGIIFDANPLEWEILVLNLLKNAAEAALKVENPTVRAELERIAVNRVRMTVSDNGEHISDEDFKRLSRPLTSVKEEGLGLGLSIVHGIVEAHGARMHFVRNRTRGVSAVIEIDLRPTQKRAETGESEDAVE